MAKDQKNQDALTDLLAIAPTKLLTDLILHLVAESTDLQIVQSTGN